ncbi:MAG: hypothetical protein ACTH5L_09270 [Halomonas sp.]|nr:MULTISPECIES: hypothetical protein [Halomonas]
MAAQANTNGWHILQERASARDGVGYLFKPILIAAHIVGTEGKEIH